MSLIVIFLLTQFVQSLLVDFRLSLRWNLNQYLNLKNEGFAFVGQSYLFWEYVRILHECKPKYFFLENVLMSEKWENVISETLGVKPEKLDSALVSAQTRKRLYWTNIEGYEPPQDRGLFLRDIVIQGSRSYLSEKTASRKRAIANLRSLNEKSGCLLATAYKLAQANGMTNIIDSGGMRCLSPIEFERLQGVPDNFTNCVSATQRYKMLGNGWNIESIKQFFKHIK